MDYSDSLEVSAFSVLYLDSAISPRSPGCLEWRIVFRDHSQGARGAYFLPACLLLSRLFQWKEKIFLWKEHHELLLMFPVKIWPYSIFTSFL